MLQETIIKHKNESIKSTDTELKSSYRVIVGEFERQPSKILSDKDVVSILKKLKKSEMERLNYTSEKTSVFIECLNKYIPEELTEQEVREYIENFDFSTVKNPMQIMSVMQKEFPGRVNTDIVKNILISIKK